jgi:hypothetical protein
VAIQNFELMIAEKENRLLSVTAPSESSARLPPDSERRARPQLRPNMRDLYIVAGSGDC